MTEISKDMYYVEMRRPNIEPSEWNVISSLFPKRQDATAEATRMMASDKHVFGYIEYRIGRKTMTVAPETRNVIDHYAYWTHDAILADLDAKRHNFSVLCVNLGNDFNIATVIRNANAFLANEVFIYGRKKWDRRGAVGTHNYNRMTHFGEDDLDALLTHIGDMYVVCIDNVDNAEDINEMDWPTDKHVLIVMGQEQIGIPQLFLDKCDKVCYIPQYGSVRSLNVGTASGIAMNSYCRKVVNNG